MSGAGLWRFSIARLPESEMKPFDFQLASVAFYQLADTEDGIATKAAAPAVTMNKCGQVG
jgi:hypothetical protein